MALLALIIFLVPLSLAGDSKPYFQCSVRLGDGAAKSKFIGEDTGAGITSFASISFELSKNITRTVELIWESEKKVKVRVCNKEHVTNSDYAWNGFTKSIQVYPDKENGDKAREEEKPEGGNLEKQATIDCHLIGVSANSTTDGPAIHTQRKPVSKTDSVASPRTQGSAASPASSD